MKNRFLQHDPAQEPRFWNIKDQENSADLDQTAPRSGSALFVILSASFGGIILTVFCFFKFNPFVTNGLSHPYHLD